MMKCVSVTEAKYVDVVDYVQIETICRKLNVRVGEVPNTIQALCMILSC